MRRVAILSALAAVILLAPGAARAQSFTFGLTGGVAAPTGDFGDVYKNGFMGGAFGDFWMNNNLGIGLDVLYSKNDAESGFGDRSLTLIPITAHAKLAFTPQSAMVTPWVQGGAGMYNLSSKVETITGSSTSSDTKFGFHFGGGLDFRTMPTFGVGLAAMYHIVPDGLASGTSANWFTAGVNVTFNTTGTSTVGGRPLGR